MRSLPTTRLIELRDHSHVIPLFSCVRLRTPEVLHVDRYVCEDEWQPRAGEKGVIVHEYGDYPGVYEMEVVNPGGSTRALLTVREDQVRVTWVPGEMLSTSTS
jgi:hypothetical protein